MEKLENIIKEHGLKPLQREDTFRFRCTCCGACCRNREDIILNIHDILRIQSYLNISFHTLLEKYCDLYVGFQSRIPIVRIQPKGKNKICPFLYKGKCKIHTIKPTVCALFPLARVTGVNPEDNTVEIGYALQEIACGAKDQINKVQDWIGSYDSKESLEISSKWNELIAKASNLVHNFEFAPGEEFYSYMTYLLYEDYPQNSNLVEEINRRIQVLSDLNQKIGRGHEEK